SQVIVFESLAFSFQKTFNHCSINHTFSPDVIATGSLTRLLLLGSIVPKTNGSVYPYLLKNCLMKKPDDNLITMLAFLLANQIITTKKLIVLFHIVLTEKDETE
ncbi:MAG: hypothetical protein AAGI66_09330, partial [Cyanobacteria bacterium P01_H01_bin.74]